MDQSDKVTSPTPETAPHTTSCIDTDPAIEALDLSETAKEAAYFLKRPIPP